MLEKLLRLSDDNRRVYMTVVQKDDDAPLIEKTQIIDWLIENAVDHFYRFDSTIDNVLAKINASEGPGEEEPDDALIAELRDASVIVRLDDDEMTAFLRVNGACGGCAIKAKDFLDALKKAHVVRGVKKQKLQKFLTASSRLKAGEYLEVSIASGKSPVQGEDSKLTYLVQDSKSRVLKPQERDDGTVDMLDLGKMITVQEGQLLAKSIPPTKGSEGFKVTGEVLACIPGNTFPIKLYPGSKFSENDQTIVMAETSGLPILHSDGVEVDNALCMKAVTVVTGHVNFEGSIIIDGDVQVGMKVQARGSITVGGVVESASLKAGGDIIIYNGILGRQEQPESEITAILESKGSVIVRFAQYAKIIADVDIVISQHAMHCQTFAKGDLIVCDQSKRHGTLIGGVHIISGGIRVVTLGAPSGIHTYVRAFTGLREIMSNGYTIKKELDNEYEQLAKVKDAESKLLQQAPNKRSKELIERLSWTKTHHFERITDLKAKMETRFLELESILRRYSIKVVKNCYAGVHCQIGDHTLTVSREYGPSNFVTNGKDILIEPL